MDAVGAALGDEEVAVGGADDDAGLDSPVANSVTSNPSGAFGQAPSGRVTALGRFFAEGVS